MTSLRRSSEGRNGGWMFFISHHPNFTSSPSLYLPFFSWKKRARSCVLQRKARITPWWHLMVRVWMSSGVGWSHWWHSSYLKLYIEKSVWWWFGTLLASPPAMIKRNFFLLIFLEISYYAGDLFVWKVLLHFRFFGCESQKWFILRYFRSCSSNEKFKKTWVKLCFLLLSRFAEIKNYFRKSIRSP